MIELAADLLTGFENTSGVQQTDFYPWTPSHPSNEDKCLFGHVTEYQRKKPESLCYIGPKLGTIHTVLQNCSCSIFDFECDYNYQRANDGTCQIIPGLDPLDHSLKCSKPGALAWTEPTGYRKVPLTTCIGGKTFDQGTLHACPGHEKEVKDARRGLSGFGLLVAIVLPFLLASGIGYYIWRIKDRMALGQIRLGDDSFDTSISTGRDRAQQYVLAVSTGLSRFIASVATVALFMDHAIRSRFSNSPPAYYHTLSDDAGLLSDNDDDALDEEI